MGIEKVSQTLLIPSTLLVHRDQLSIQFCCPRKVQRMNCKLRLASWNVCTLLDSAGCHERRTAIIARELARYRVDIAALSETRFSGETELTEVNAGYTFFCIGLPEGHPRQAGVGFAVKTSLLPLLEVQPQGLPPRLMTLQLKLKHDNRAFLISAYAPTMAASEDQEESFYEHLNTVLQSVPHKHRIFLMGDFNARVGSNVLACPGATFSGKRKNTNGTLLLEIYAQYELAITNSFYQQANKYKTTWQHPRSKHWHVLDYIITRQEHLREVNITRAMRGTSCWSDHRLLRSVVSLDLAPSQQHRAKRRKRLDVSKGRNPMGDTPHLQL